MKRRWIESTLCRNWKRLAILSTVNPFELTTIHSRSWERQSCPKIAVVRQTLAIRPPWLRFRIHIRDGASQTTYRIFSKKINPHQTTIFQEPTENISTSTDTSASYNIKRNISNTSQTFMSHRFQTETNLFIFFHETWSTRRTPVNVFIETNRLLLTKRLQKNQETFSKHFQFNQYVHASMIDGTCRYPRSEQKFHLITCFQFLWTLYVSKAVLLHNCITRLIDRGERFLDRTSAQRNFCVA